MTVTATRTTVRPAAPWRALPVILLAQFLSVLDFFIVNVALPDVGRTLHAGPAALEFVVAGYGLAFACTLVAGGRLGDTYGRRRTFRVGILAFTIASALCGLAPDAGVLIATRALQGLAAALMVPQVLGTIQATFDGRDRQRALGLFGMVTGSAAVIGQVLGGALVSADVAGLSWRPIFLVNVPVGLLALAAARVVPQTRAASPAPVDVRGAVLLAATILALLVPLASGRQLGWPLWCWLALAAVPALALATRAAQRRTERNGGAPLLAPALLAEPGMRRGLPVALLFFPSFGGFMLTTAVTLQAGLGYPAIRGGLALAPLALTYMLTALAARRLHARWGRAGMAGGALLYATGMLLFALQSTVDYADLSTWRLIPATALIGAGGAMVMVPLFGVVLAAVPARVAGTASGILTTTQQTALALGAGTLGTLFFALAARYGWAPATAATLVAEAVPALAAAAAVLRLPSH
jgi:MFS family permease